MRPSTKVVVALCGLITLLEGYDQFVFGAVVPVLLKDPAWLLPHSVVGYIASAAFVGMLIGALVSGVLAERFGRRPVIIASVVCFGIFGALCAVADTALSLAILRFLTGLGLGGVLPTTSALTLEYADGPRRNLIYAGMFAAIPLGGCLSALLAVPILPTWGPPGLFLLSVVPVLIALPLAWRYLPESREVGKRSSVMPTLFAPEYRRITLLFIGATFCGLLVWYGLGSWLPGIMRELDYGLTSSLAFQITLNGGAVIGSLIVALGADRFGGRKVIIGGYAVMAFVLMTLSIQLGASAAFIAVALAGTTAQAGLVLINAYVTRSFPAGVRAGALGVTLGLGRAGAIVGPMLVAPLVGAAPAFTFLVFAAVAVLCAVFVAVVPRTKASPAPEAVAT